MEFFLRIYNFRIPLIVFVILISNLPNNDLSQIKSFSLHSMSNDYQTENTFHNSIKIYGNQQFDQLAALEGWKGEGTKDNPFIIENYHFQDSDVLIMIVSTTVHFIIQNNTLIGSTGFDQGILLDTVENGIIRNNSISNRANGILLLWCTNINIISNKISGNRRSGVRIEYSSKLNFINNIIYDNQEHGYLFSGSESNFILNNEIYRNNNFGIILESQSNQNILENNTIFSNRKSGLGIESNVLGCIIPNKLECNTFMSVFISDFSFGNKIQHNLVKNNTEYGVWIGLDSSGNKVSFNDFNSNNQEGISQAYDDGFNNTFEYNYWDDWLEPDANQDNIVDNPYQLDGTAFSSDPFPFTSSALEYESSSRQNQFVPPHLFAGLLILLIIIAILTFSLKKQ